MKAWIAPNSHETFEDAVKYCVNGFASQSDCFYTIEFEEAYKGKRTYTGYTAKTVKDRCTAHLAGAGSNFLKYVARQGIRFRVVGVYPRPQDVYYFIIEKMMKETKKVSYYFNAERHKERALRKFSKIVEKARTLVQDMSIEEQKRFHYGKGVLTRYEQ